MADDNKVSEILKGIVGELKGIASSQTVIGEPITVGERTVLPIVKISVGFGAGGGQNETSEKESSFGAGGGGGARIEPAAFIIIDRDKISMLTATPGKFDSLIDAVPALFGKIKELKDKFKKDSPEEESEGSTEKDNENQTGGDDNPIY